MSTGKTYYFPSYNTSVTATRKTYSITKYYAYSNVVMTMSGEHNSSINTVTIGYQCGNITAFVGSDEYNKIIGWDYSVEYENNNSGSVSGTLSISNNTYNNLQTAALTVGIVALAAATIASGGVVGVGGVGAAAVAAGLA